MSILMESNDVAKPICEAMGIDVKQARRIILDLEAGSPIRVYVEMYASEKFLDLNWAIDKYKAEIVVLDKGREP